MGMENNSPYNILVSLRHLVSNTFCNHGSNARTWKGHLWLCSAIQEKCSHLAEALIRGCERANIQACQEGTDTFSNRCDSSRFSWCCTGQVCDRKQDPPNTEGKRFGSIPA